MLCKSADMMGNWYVENINTYCSVVNGTSTEKGRKGYCYNLNGDQIKVYDDCSGFVWACLVQAGYYSTSTPVFTSGSYLENGAATEAMEAAGFEWIPMTELTADDIQKGDILVRNGHVEIFNGYNIYDFEVAWSWGKVYTEEPTAKNTSKNKITTYYSGVWRLKNE